MFLKRKAFKSIVKLIDFNVSFNLGLFTQMEPRMHHTGTQIAPKTTLESLRCDQRELQEASSSRCLKRAPKQKNGAIPDLFRALETHGGDPVPPKPLKKEPSPPMEGATVHQCPGDPWAQYMIEGPPRRAHPNTRNSTSVAIL